MEKQRILIIEDDVNTSTVLVRILVKDGYITDCTHSGEQAVSLISEKDYDLLVNDLDLPLSTMKNRLLARLEHEYLTKLLRKYQGSIKRTAAPCRSRCANGAAKNERLRSG